MTSVVCYTGVPPVPLPPCRRRPCLRTQAHRTGQTDTATRGAGEETGWAGAVTRTTWIRGYASLSKESGSGWAQQVGAPSKTTARTQQGDYWPGVKKEKEKGAN